MKMILALFIVALVFAIVTVGICLAILRSMNELRKKTCGKCDFCDEALNHCWMRGISVRDEDPSCDDFQKKEKEHYENKDSKEGHQGVPDQGKADSSGEESHA